MKNSKLIPGIGRIPFPAYRGDEPYIFISYAHDDAEKVFTEISRFNNQGYHIWYDEGLAPGNEWEDEIAEHLERCTLFVVFLTPASVSSQNVRDEIFYALDEEKDIIGIYLEEATLSGGLRLRLGSKQAILKYKMSDNEYLYKYTEAFARYGFSIPICYNDNEITDNYKPLTMDDETVVLLAEKIYQNWKSDNKDRIFSKQEDDIRTYFMIQAQYAFYIAKAGCAEIFPNNFTMGIRAFAHSNIEYRILEEAQIIAIEDLSKKGWRNGRYNYKEQTFPLVKLGYRSEPEEDRMERIVQIIKNNGYDFFKSITKEEKEALFLEMRKDLTEKRLSHSDIENLRLNYGNFPEIEDMINDAHFSSF